MQSSGTKHRSCVGLVQALECEEYKLLEPKNAKLSGSIPLGTWTKDTMLNKKNQYDVVVTEKMFGDVVAYLTWGDNYVNILDIDKINTEELKNEGNGEVIIHYKNDKKGKERTRHIKSQDGTYVSFYKLVRIIMYYRFSRTGAASAGRTSVVATLG